MFLEYLNKYSKKSLQHLTTFFISLQTILDEGFTKIFKIFNSGDCFMSYLLNRKLIESTGKRQSSVIFSRRCALIENHVVQKVWDHGNMEINIQSDTKNCD